MKFQYLTDIPDEKLIKLVMDVFKFSTVRVANKDKDNQVVKFAIQFEEDEAEEPFVLSMNYAEPAYAYDFTVLDEEQSEVRKFMLANGCDWVFFNNPYLEEE